MRRTALTQRSSRSIAEIFPNLLDLDVARIPRYVTTAGMQWNLGAIDQYSDGLIREGVSSVSRWHICRCKLNPNNSVGLFVRADDARYMRSNYYVRNALRPVNKNSDGSESRLRAEFRPYRDSGDRSQVWKQYKESKSWLAEFYFGC